MTIYVCPSVSVCRHTRNNSLRATRAARAEQSPMTRRADYGRVHRGR